MIINMFRGFVYNAALLLALGMIYDTVASPDRQENLFSRIMTGFYLSGITLAVMFYPWVLYQGVVFDTRSIILSVTAFFFGVIPTAMAVTVAVVYRLSMGGDGMYAGSLVVIASALCGYLMKRLHHRWKKPYNNTELYTLGLITSSAMIMLMLLIPHNALQVVKTIFFPVIIIYPLVTVILGNSIKYRIKLALEKRDLKETRLLFNSLSASVAPIWMSDLEGEIVWFSQSWLDLRGRTLEQELGHGWKEGLHPDDLATLQERNMLQIRNHQTFIETNRILDHAGEYRTFRNAANPRYDHNGNFIGYIGMCQDITERIRAEQALVASEQKYRSLAETMQDLIIIHRLDGSVIFANTAALNFLGITEDMIHGVNILHSVHPDYLDLMTEHTSQRRNGFTGSRIYQIELIDPQQQTKPFEVSTSMLPNTSGDLEFVAVLRDMSERKMKELALRQSEEKYRSLVESSMSVISMFDYEGTVLFANKHAAARFGFEVDDFIGMKMSDIFPPHIAEYQLNVIRKVIDTGEATITEAESIVQDEVRWYHTGIVPIFDAENKAFMAVINATDITQIKLAEIHVRESEQRLRESQSRFQQFLDHIPGVAYIKDFDSTYLFINKFIKDRIGTADWVGKTPFEVFPPDDAQKNWEDDQLAKQLRFKQMTDVYLNESGVAAYHDTYKFVIDTPDGQPLIGGMSLNVTDRFLAQKERDQYAEQLEQRVAERTMQLESANTELEAYSYLIAHDLRAPLRAIGGFANIIVEDYADKLDAEGLRLLSKISSNTNQMQEMIRSLLELAKLERNIGAFRSIDMNLIVQNSINELADEVTQNLFDIQLDDLSEAIADNSLIHHVWTNLLSNAIKFTMPQAEKQIHIGCYEEEEQLVYFIRDSGVGFDSQYSERAFGVFNRLHKATEFEGTGIGLAIVKKVMKLHNGAVWAESEEGKGSTFYFAIPKTPQTQNTYDF
ncbi:MAG: hypothetical protein CVU48_00735 [Candidatus Cloacimonetes bacterium HGW-Cloacimonetes-1]|jgi:PAS domain S-box-containing protein|nr:MAG: hypothetical protein CVU48_00735 [Candidatus Cloacimonetes bacterium HGW-Cloacimonetes-1]